MNNKMFNFRRLLSTVLLGVTFVLTSCDYGKDLYNPELLQEKAKEAFPVKNIDSKQTWETSAACNASVTVNEKTNDIFTIKLYAGSPYNTNGNAKLLAKTSVRDGQTANFKFDAPTALNFVYVMKVDSKGYSSAKPVAVENGAVKVTFGREETDAQAIAATRAYSGKFFTPEIPGDEAFPTKSPDNCGDINNYEEHKNGIPYLLKDKTYNSIDPYEGATIYIQGEVTLKSWREPNGTTNPTNFYLLPNATLTLGMEQLNHRPNSIFSIGNGARLIANNTNLKGEESSKFFNKGTIKASAIELTNSYVYNANVIEAKGVLLTNDESKFCNATDAKLTTSELKIQNGHFLNETDGSVTVNGLTTSINGSWENAGQYTTTNMNKNTVNQNVKNTCRLTITEKLNLHGGGIYNESYIECSTLEIDNTTVNMAPKSFFVVKEEAKFSYNGNPGQGFIASATGEKAVLKMKRATRAEGIYRNMTYSGQLFIACNDHFSEKQDDWNPYYMLINGAELSGEDNANISIDKSECNPGYNSTPDSGGDNDTPQAYAYAFEDMMTEAGDYDFNDVVLYISTPIDEKVLVSLQAAGGIKKLSVGFNNNGKTQTIFADVHEALGVPPGTITNTGEATGTVPTVEINVGKNFSLTDSGDFYISDGKREVHIPKFTIGFKPGNVPYALRVASANWKWPKERIQITEAYLDFAGWAQDATTEPTWYNNPISDKVMN